MDGHKVEPNSAEFSGENKLRQVDAVSGGRGNTGGHRQAARELNIPEAAVRRAYQTASLSPEAQEAAVETGLDDNRSALLAAAKERTPEAQTATIRRLAEPNASTAEPDTPAPSAKPLRNLVGISGGEFAKWIRITTPNDRPHVIRVLEMAAAILRDELESRARAVKYMKGITMYSG